MGKVQRVFGVLAIVASLALAGCGGGEGGASTAGGIKTTGTVYPVVAGMAYRTDSGSGVIASDGSYTYKADENVTFSAGGIALATVPVAAKVTPLPLGNDVASTNLLRLLKALDTDGDLSNGVTLPALPTSNLTIDLTSQSSVAAALASLKPAATLPSATDAGVAAALAAAKATAAGTTAPAATAFTGSYTGTYSGADSGTIALTIAADGKVSATGKSTLDPTYSFTISGTAAATGKLILSGSDSEGNNAAFTGTVTSQGGNLAGTWTVAGSSGTFTAHKTTTPVTPLPPAPGDTTPAGTQLGGARQGSALNLTTAVTTLAGSGTADSIDGTGRSASFNRAYGMTTDGTNLFVTDLDGYKIRKVVIATGVVTTLAGGTFGTLDGTGSAAQFKAPFGITTDGINLYVADYDRVRKIEIATGAVTTLAGPKVGVSSNGAAIDFVQLRGITTDGTYVYAADMGVIRKVAIATGQVTVLAGGGSGPLVRSGYADGTGKAALFGGIEAITTDGSNLYVTDNGNRKIRKIVIATGVVTTLAGGGGPGYNGGGFADGTGTAAAFLTPVGITTDGANLYVVDNGNSRVRKIVIATGVVTTIAGPGPGSLASILDADATGSAATFFYPIGITSNGRSLYVSDFTLVRKIQ